MNIETGRQGASRVVWERLDVLLGVEGVLVEAFDVVAAAKAEWDRVGSVIDLVESAFGPGAGVHASGSVSDVCAAAVRWLVSDRYGVSTVPSGHRVGRVDVARLQAARDRFKAVDNEFGGAAALPLMAEYVRNEVRPLLNAREMRGFGCWCGLPAGGHVE